MNEKLNKKCHKIKVKNKLYLNYLYFIIKQLLTECQHKMNERIVGRIV